MEKRDGRFRDKHQLNFPLLADTDHKVAEQYGAWRERVRFGKRSMGIQRSTFLIDAEGGREAKSPRTSPLNRRPGPRRSDT